MWPCSSIVFLRIYYIKPTCNFWNLWTFDHLIKESWEKRWPHYPIYPFLFLANWSYLGGAAAPLPLRQNFLCTSHYMIINVVSPSQHEILMMLLVPVNMKHIIWYYNQCCGSESTYSNVVDPSQHEIYYMIL